MLLEIVDLPEKHELDNGNRAQQPKNTKTFSRDNLSNKLLIRNFSVFLGTGNYSNQSDSLYLLHYKLQP